MKYIDSEKLIAEIERLKDKYPSWQLKLAMDDLCNSITSLQQEQPEVDLEKEIDLSIRLMPGVHSLEDSEQWYKGRYENIKELAHHFYELGLNARKEE